MTIKDCQVILTYGTHGFTKYESNWLGDGHGALKWECA